MESSQKVSVLIPAHNEENYLGKCLDSLLALNNPNVEIIVCNNNSTDRTCDIVQQYPTVHLVHETKKGPNAARQKAFESSSGSIIATLDADCIVPKNWINQGISHFSKPNVVAVSGVCDFDNQGLLSVILTIATRYIMRFVHLIAHHIVGTHGIMMGANAWYRRTALENIGGFNADIEFFGDDAHTAQMLSKEGIIDYDIHLRVMTSSRRFNQGGWIRTMYHYSINYLSMWISGKQITPKKKTHHYR